MTRGVKTLGPEGNLAEASDLMAEHRIRHVPIVDTECRILGLVSQRDLLRGALGGGSDLPSSIQRAYLRSIGVTEVMIETLEVVEPTTPIREATRRMLDQKIGSLLVMENGRLVGILTEHDFVRYVDQLPDIA
mgnify:CR=1 FL=1